MQSINEILNSTGDESATESTGADTSQEATTEGEEATGETTQVAAEESGAVESPTQIKDELSALAKERARIREKELKLDEELAKLSASGNSTDESTASRTVATSDLRAELKNLRKQHRDALVEGLEDEAVEALEEKMEELRQTIYNQANQTATAQERANNEFNAVFSTVHTEFPFLQVDHPDMNQELNEDINAHYLGRMQKGDPPAVALRKAVDKFAPAYAKSLGGISTTDTSAEEKAKKATANKLIADKLNKGGFSEVRSVGRSQATKPFTGATPMEDILKPKKAA